MILLLAGAAIAGSCCTTGGTQPSVLASCDRLGMGLGVGADVAYGGWAWDRRWSAAGDDGEGTATVAATVMGRLSPWLQGGLRLPLALSLNRLDGETRAELGMGRGLLWLDLETPADWPIATAPQVGLQVGLGTTDPVDKGAFFLQVGLRASYEATPWALWGNLTGRAGGSNGLEGELSLVADHTIGSRLRVGLGLGLWASPGAVARYAASVGPTLVWTPTHHDRIVVGVQSGLPLRGLGQNSPSRLMVTFDWYRVLAHTKG